MTRTFRSVARVARHSLVAVLGVTVFAGPLGADESVSYSGIYPGLAMFGDEGECGTGAVVPWADRLWVVTYAPHSPEGSSNKLYEITPALEQIVRPESIGGTPANRMIHDESRQLFLGPYAIDAARNVRTIPYTAMFGRPTGNARHLTDPVNKIYCATMEEGLYEVDVHSLAVSELWADEAKAAGRHAELPGYHGKGLYSGQGRLIYANNGDHAPAALTDPKTPSGVLAEWDGRAPAWSIVRRNQFTEVTGPGGILGNPHPDTDPIWTIGWDHRSLILMVLDGGKWRAFRLPKASHTYDGAHGWNTEWPRIREIGENDLLMTMHGMFWKVPRTFSAANTAGLRPRSSYLKVIGDFCRWNDRLVFGCDDTAASAFLNKRRLSGGIAGAGLSQSNLWFTDPGLPNHLGPTLASGAVWLRDPVKAGDVSDPFLFAGWQRRSVHVANEGRRAVDFVFERDPDGRGNWKVLGTLRVGAGRAKGFEFDPRDTGEWVRVRAQGDCAAATVLFACSNPDPRGTQAGAIFDGVARVQDPAADLAGLVRASGKSDRRVLQLAALRATDAGTEDAGYYELDGAMQLSQVADEQTRVWMKTNVAIPRDLVSVDPASILVVDDKGHRWRLPKGDPAYDEPTRTGALRVCREVVTERDLLNVAGTCFELPAENAGGFGLVRPIASHNLRVMDFCSYRGLLVLSGVDPRARAGAHLVRSADGNAALWVGALDDLWQLGKPVGRGGPWANTRVEARQPSDPYLLWGYDRRTLTLSADARVHIRIDVDLTGDGFWVTHQEVALRPHVPFTYRFPDAFQARWVRFVADRACTATAQLEYR